jgi:carbamoyltransferase
MAMEKKEYTLGISLGHDSGVALLCDEQILFAANEERFSRVKGHSGFPAESLEYVLSNFDIPIANVAIDGKFVAPHGDEDAYRFEGPAPALIKWANASHLDSILLGSRLGVSVLRSFYVLAHLPARTIQNKKIRESVLANTELGTFSRIDHHFAHAASVVLPRERAGRGTVVTLDGVGEGVCSRVLDFEGGKFRQKSWQPAIGSPALMYGYLTRVLGYKINRHEGKLTGLAAFGSGDEVYQTLRKYFSYDSGKNLFEAKKIGYGYRAIKKLQSELSEIAPSEIAAGVQRIFEENVLSYISRLQLEFKGEKLYLAGGAFANVKLNQRILELNGISGISVAPNMGDGGLALGAASMVHKSHVTLDSLYLGSKPEEVAPSELSSLGLKVSYSDDDLPMSVAKKLADKKIVAVARDRMEYGPRALGNRSILYSTSDREVNTWLNKKLRRTEFMPFAPICREIDAHKYFELSMPPTAYSNMTITCNVTEHCKNVAPAIVHVDGTARPQILTRDQNPFVYDLISSYAALTGEGILVNTSFNMHEEPIVRTGLQAVRAYLDSSIDYLVLNDQIIYRDA